jgi:hypothetical protein
MKMLQAEGFDRSELVASLPHACSVGPFLAHIFAVESTPPLLDMAEMPYPGPMMDPYWHLENCLVRLPFAPSDGLEKGFFVDKSKNQVA